VDLFLHGRMNYASEFDVSFDGTGKVSDISRNAITTERVHRPPCRTPFPKKDVRLSRPAALRRAAFFSPTRASSPAIASLKWG